MWCLWQALARPQVFEALDGLIGEILTTVWGNDFPHALGNWRRQGNLIVGIVVLVVSLHYDGSFGDWKGVGLAESALC